MSKIRICADSTCDLSPELIEKYNITITPLQIFLGDKDYTDQKDIFPQTIYDYVAKTGILPKTAAVSVGTYTDVFTELKKDCDEIIHFTISSEMSSCYQNAKLAAEEIGGIYVVDSRTLSSGIGHLAIEAAIMAQDETKTGQEIFDYVTSLVDRLNVSFVINSVNYLYKGGRCGGRREPAQTQTAYRGSFGQNGYGGQIQGKHERRCKEIHSRPSDASRRQIQERQNFRNLHLHRLRPAELRKRNCRKSRTV